MKGGARNRSGPLPDPDSERSERRGYSLEFLPPTGYDGDPPAWPLPDATERELAIWGEVWATPQACAWSLPSQHWQWPIVALYARTKARCESPTVPSGVMSQLHRLGDQIGMTTAGLHFMGWRIGNAPTTNPAPAGDLEAPSTDQLGERRERRLRG